MTTFSQLAKPPENCTKDELNKWVEENLFGKKVQVKKWVEGKGRYPGAIGTVVSLGWIYSEQLLLGVRHDDGTIVSYSIIGHIREGNNGNFYDSELRFL